jgi:hypothetical protein
MGDYSYKTGKIADKPNRRESMTRGKKRKFHHLSEVSRLCVVVVVLNLYLGLDAQPLACRDEQRPGIFAHICHGC